MYIFFLKCAEIRIWYEAEKMTSILASFLLDNNSKTAGYF